MSKAGYDESEASGSVTLGWDSERHSARSGGDS